MRCRTMLIVSFAAAFCFAMVGGLVAAVADSLELRVVSETDSTITLGWTPQQGYGYLFSKDGRLVSRTNDPARSQVRFSKDATVYEVAVIVKGATGTYPPPTPPPPPPVAACSDGLDNDTDGFIDLADPGCENAADMDETNITSGASLFLAANGSDTNQCVQTSPCRTLNRVYQLAQCGTVVEIAGGAYQSQTIEANAALANCQQRVVFTEATGANATFGSVSINRPASHIELRNLAIAPFVNIGWNSAAGTEPRVRDIRLVNIDTQSFHMFYVDGVHWTGGDVGPADADGNPVVEHPWIGEAGNWAAKNITIENVYFHDVYASANNNHTECLLITSVDGLLLRGNRFYNCDSTGAIYATEINFSSPNGYCTGIVAENNWFMPGPAGSGPKFESDCGALVRNNTFSPGAGLNLQSWTVAPGNGPTQQVQVYGNYGAINGCGGGSEFVHRDNVWIGRTCNTSDLQVSGLQVISATDLHLAAGSAAINQGHLPNYPPFDIDGDPRYLGSGPDAGADEKE